MPKRTDLKALRNLISQADRLLSTTALPEGSSQRAHELLGAAIAIADILLESRADPADAFSKSLENHRAAIALHFAYYNFCRIHQTLRVTPAMEAGIAGHVWTVAELLA